MRCLLLAVFLLLPAVAAKAENLVRNGGFEEGLSAWQWRVTENLEATGQLDATVFHGGNASFHMTRTTKHAPNVYGQIIQAVSVKPDTKYRLSAWGRGRDVRYTWLGAGYGLRERFPERKTFDWEEVSLEFTTGADEVVKDIMIVIDNTTEMIWVDDVRLTELTDAEGVDLYDPTVLEDLSTCRLYPALPESGPRRSPLVRLTGDGPKGPAGSLRIGYSKKGLHFFFDIIDDTPSQVEKLQTMWQGDSIQIAVDTAPEVAKDGYDSNCYEICLALRPSGKLDRFCNHRAGRDVFAWGASEASGERTDTGYILRAFLPWESLNTPSGRVPKELGINVLINDADLAGTRRFVEWTEGIGRSKSPHKYNRVFLVRSPVGFVSFDYQELFSAEESIEGWYEDYPPDGSPAGELILEAENLENNEVTSLGRGTLPEIGAGVVRRVSFRVIAGRLDGEGRWRLRARAGRVSARSNTFRRLDIGVEVKDRLAREKARLERLRARAAEAGQAGNVYVDCARYVAERFFDRIENNRGTPPDTLPWKLLQIREIEYVLDETELLLDRIVAGKAPPLAVPRPTGGAVEMRDGAFHTEVSVPGGEPYASPYYFYGYEGKDAQKSIPDLWRIGATLIQRWKGVGWAMERNGTYKGGTWPLDEAQKHRVKVDMLLDLHSFPSWAMEENPDIRIQGEQGFIGFIIDHPVARRVAEQFATGMAGVLGRRPALFGICLSNEPIYCASGRDPWSRPLYVDFLRKRHGAVDAMNGLFGTDYAGFDDVPEPATTKPEELGAQRAFFDWCEFNRDHFLDWHEWLHGLVKKAAPHVLTHTKTVTINYKAWGMWHGYDPERMCRITDIAGNDEVLYYGDGRHWELGEYAFDWMPQAMGYDFQYAVKGQPTFNSENHIIPDNTTDPVPPQHTRIGLWHGALHHMGATAIWVYVESGGANFLKGSIYYRPANIYAAGRTMFDLNRLAKEVSMVSAQRPRVAILHSLPSLYWDENFVRARRDVYAALTFLGEPVGFLTERQLADGDLRDYDWIIVPGATAVRRGAVDGLAACRDGGAKIVFYGDGNLARDEYLRERELGDAFRGAIRIPRQESAPALQARLRTIFSRNGLSRPQLANVATGRPAWGVDYRVVPHGKAATLVSMVNLLSDPVTVSLALPGEATDLITGDPKDLKSVSLAPMDFVLMEVK